MNPAFDGRRFALRRCGEDVTIYEWVRVLAPEGIEIDDHVIIDDFVFLDGKGGLVIGTHVHIAGYVSISGGGRAEVGAFAGIAAGSRIVTGTDLADGSGLIGPTIAPDLRAVQRGVVRIGAHAFIGTNVVVHPNVTVGEGAVVGSGGVVTKDLEPWTVNIGAPAVPVRARPSSKILRLADEQLRRDRGEIAHPGPAGTGDGAGRS